jgi:hypothetical protein
MLRSILTAMVLVFSTTSFAQTVTSEKPETLLDSMNLSSGPVVHGGFGAPVYKFTNLGGKGVNLFGGRGAWLVNRTYFLGGFGYGLVSDIGADNGNLDMGYGGLMAGYNLLTNKMVHATFLLQAGSGELNVSKADDERLGLADFESSAKRDRFSVIEPEVLVETNITRFFRIGVGAGYRYVSGIDDNILPETQVSGWAGTVAFNFGRF